MSRDTHNDSVASLRKIFAESRKEFFSGLLDMSRKNIAYDFTPPTWKCSGNPENGYVIFPADESDRNTPIAEVKSINRGKGFQSYEDERETEANVRLIMKAPEMLYALIQARIAFQATGAFMREQGFSDSHIFKICCGIYDLLESIEYWLNDDIPADNSHEQAEV